jgi:hypothetical protein
MWQAVIVVNHLPKMIATFQWRGGQAHEGRINRIQLST